MNDDFELAMNILAFYANKNNWKFSKKKGEPFPSSIINEDLGQLARITIEAISDKRKRVRMGKLTWLTEEMAAIGGYGFKPAPTKEMPNAYIITHHRVLSSQTNYFGIDFKPEFESNAARCPFPSKSVALIALTKYIERTNRKSQIIDSYNKTKKMETSNGKNL